MHEVTEILCQIERGDAGAAERLLTQVYEELRKLAAARLARENPGQTLQATALVHEAYLRLVGTEAVRHWESRGHFFAAASEAMRRILVDIARRKNRIRHGGELRKVPLDQVQLPASDTPEEVVALNEALTVFEKGHPEKAEVVKLRYFAGFTIPEVAEALGISVSTANRHWSYARAWIHEEIGGKKR